MTSISDTLTQVADTLCGYPLFIVLIGGGLFLFLYSGMVSVRRLPDALAALRENRSGDAPQRGISSAQALLSVVAATVGMGNIAGVAIALAMGGPGAIFWMWISAIVGMSTKYHEGVLAILHRSTRPDGTPVGGPMHIITSGLGRRWRPLAVTFAIAGMFGTLCIINANQLAEALATAASSAGLADDSPAIRLSLGILMALIVGSVVIGGIRRIASVATVLVPFMVTTYFIMVAYIVASDIEAVPGVFASIFSEAFSLRAGWGALAGVAIIGARRAALVNDAGVGTASIMHATSANKEPVREGLIAMLGHRLRLRMHTYSRGSAACRRLQPERTARTVARHRCIRPSHTLRRISAHSHSHLLRPQLHVHLFILRQPLRRLPVRRTEQPMVHTRVHPVADTVRSRTAERRSSHVRPVLRPHGIPNHALAYIAPQKREKSNPTILQQR